MKITIFRNFKYQGNIKCNIWFGEEKKYIEYIIGSYNLCSFLNILCYGVPFGNGT